MFKDYLLHSLIVGRVWLEVLPENMIINNSDDTN